MPHATATFNGKVIAETDSFQFVEGNVYVRSPTYMINGTSPDTDQTDAANGAVPTLISRQISSQRCDAHHCLRVERHSLLLQHHGRR